MDYEESMKAIERYIGCNVIRAIDEDWYPGEDLGRIVSGEIGQFIDDIRDDLYRQTHFDAIKVYGQMQPDIKEKRRDAE